MAVKDVARFAAKRRRVDSVGGAVLVCLQDTKVCWMKRGIWLLDAGIIRASACLLCCSSPARRRLRVLIQGRLGLARCPLGRARHLMRAARAGGPMHSTVLLAVSLISPPAPGWGLRARALVLLARREIIKRRSALPRLRSRAAWPFGQAAAGTCWAAGRDLAAVRACSACRGDGGARVRPERNVRSAGSGLLWCASEQLYNQTAALGRPNVAPAVPFR